MYREFRRKFRDTRSFGDTISKDVTGPFGQCGIVSPKLRRRPPARYRAEFRRRRGKDMWVWHIVIAAFLAAIAYAFLPHRAAAAEPLVALICHHVVFLALALPPPP